MRCDDVDFKRLVHGDKAAWDTFVERTSPIVYAAIRKLLVMYRGAVQDADAQEIYQNVFLRLIKDDFRLLKMYDPAKSSLGTWLTIVARSAALDYVRRLRPATTPLDDEIAASPPTRATASEPLDLPEGLLSPRRRLVLVLLFERDMDIEEIAQLLRVEAQTVRSTKHKAIEKLRGYVGRSGRP